MAEPLRVLLVSGEYPPMEGGVADYARILAEELVAQGACVHVLTSTAGAGDGAGAVTCHPVMVRWGWRALRREVSRLVGAVGPDVVNVQYQTAAYGLHPAINLLPLLERRVPVVTTFHDLRVPYLFPKAGPLRAWANLALARASAATIVTNVQDREELARHAGLRPAHLIPIGSNVTPAGGAGRDAAASRERWGIPAGAVVLCYFGFLNASKGGDDLVEALHLLRGRGVDAVLLMIGGAVGASDPTNRAYLDGVRRRIEERGLGGHVVWTGYLEPAGVSEAFGCSDVCVLPYRDGASYRRGSLMAALAHGMAIVTTRPQVEQPGLTHAETAWFVPPGDPAALAEACTLLGRDRALRGRLGEGARRLSERFAWPAIAARTLEVYRAVVRR